MSPRLHLPSGGCGEEDSHEYGRVATRGSIRASGQQVVAVSGCREDFAAQLPADQAFVEALPERRSRRFATSQRRAAFQPCQAERFPRTSFAVDTREVFRQRGGTLPADLGGRTLGPGRWPVARRGGREALGALG